MEQLKQIQKYQFWILLGVALILPLVAWSMTSSKMAAEASDRAKALDGLDKSLVTNANDPNDQFVKQVDGINADQSKQSDYAWRTLFERQLPFKVWPKDMPTDMADDPSKIDAQHQQNYWEIYPKEMERVRKVADPYDDETEKGLVRLSEDLMPHPHDAWKFQAPSPKEIVAAQEDLWLLTAILQAIASVNEGSPTVYDAPVREIVEILLRGGSPKGSSSAGGAATKTVTAAPGTGHGAADASAMMKAMGASIIAGGGADTAGGGVLRDVKIDLNEEIGVERPASDAKSGAKTAAPSSLPTTATMAAGGPMSSEGTRAMMMTSPGIGSSQVAGANMDRYCDDRKEWKTRGFSLEVIMDHRHIPQLLVELSNAEGWPINILRVHIADYKDEDVGATEGSGAEMSRMRGAKMMPPTVNSRGPSAGHGGGRAGVGAPPKMLMTPLRPPIPRGAEDGIEGPVNLNTRDPLDDPNLATVAIVGVIYIFKQPPPAAPLQPSPGTSPNGAVAGTPGTAPEAETAAAPASDAAEPAEEMPEKSDTPAAAGDSTDEPDESSPGTSEADSAHKAKPAANGKNGAGASK
jgi:hypothetical protein